MTRAERAQVVELLRCAADDDPDGTSIRGLIHAGRPMDMGHRGDPG